MSEPLVKVEELRKWFPVRRGLADALRRRATLFLKAVDGVSFDVMEREVFWQLC